MTRRHVALWFTLALLGGVTRPATAMSADPLAPALAPGTTSSGSTAPGPTAPELEPLVPELAGSPLALPPGVRPYARRLSVSPGYGRLGAEPLFALRVAYNPSQRLGWEAALGHNPGQSVHGVLHNFGVVVRQPLAGRLQPYVRAGYGMFMVSPGPSINADPVTKNALLVGGGAEFYLRGDLALRAESQLATIVGRGNDDGSAAYRYAMTTIGLAFYRTVGP
jgi:hypothetical protein